MIRSLGYFSVELAEVIPSQLKNETPRHRGSGREDRRNYPLRPGHPAGPAGLGPTRDPKSHYATKADSTSPPTTSNTNDFTFDGKCQVQELSRSQLTLRVMLSRPENLIHDYAWHVTANLFVALNVADGTTITSIRRKHRGVEFKNFLNEIDAQVSEYLDMPIV